MLFKKEKQIEITGGMVLKDNQEKRWLVAFSHKTNDDNCYVLISEPFGDRGCYLRQFEYTQTYEGLLAYTSHCCFYSKAHLVKFINEKNWCVAKPSADFAQSIIQKKILDYITLETKYEKAIQELRRSRNDTKDISERARIDMFLDVNCWDDLFK